MLWLRRRALFYRFAATMLTLSFAAALVFLVYPAAPPWTAHARGLHRRAAAPAARTAAVPVVSGTAERRQALVVREPDPGEPVRRDPVAARRLRVPRLPLRRDARLAARGWRRWVVVGLAALYPLAQSFAVVYTGNHYVVDLLIGFAFATGALLLVQRLWRRLGLPE